MTISPPLFFEDEKNTLYQKGKFENNDVDKDTERRIKKKIKGGKKTKSPAPFFQNIKNIDEVASVCTDGDDRSFASSPSHLSYYKTPFSCFFSKLIRGKNKFDDMDESSLLFYEQQLEEDELNRSEHDEISRPWNHRNFNKVRHIDEKRARSNTKCGNTTNDFSGRGDAAYHVTMHETMLDVMERLAREEELLDTKSGNKPTTLVMQTNDVKDGPAKKSMMEVMEALSDGPLTMAKSAYNTVKRRGSTVCKPILTKR